jgi:DNA-binding CsgD family transcriptional regulator
MAQHNGEIGKAGGNGKAFDGLIDAFYDTAVAAVEGCAWCNVLPEVCSAFKASAGSFLIHDFSSQEGALRHQYNIRPEFRDAYNDGLGAINPWMESMAFYEEGTAVCGEDILSDSDMVQSEFYSSYLEPQDLLHSLCGVITREGRNAYFISLLRPPGTAAFDQKDKAALSDLLPHLKRSVKVRDRVVYDRLAREGLAEIMDLLPVAFLLVGRNGRVVLKNRVAKELIAREDGLLNPADLRRFITETADAASEDGCPLKGEHFIISRGADRLPLICVMYPVSGSRLNGEQGSEPAVAVLIKDPQVERFDGLPDFAGAYDLTNAETRLIGLLTAGQGLFEAAEKLGITKNTARTHMRNIYSKVGTHRQSDLIRLFGQFSMF